MINIENMLSLEIIILIITINVKNDLNLRIQYLFFIPIEINNKLKIDNIITICRFGFR